MKYCRLCKTYHPEYDDNCPLCGAGLTEAQNKPDDGFDFAPYNSNEKKTDAKKSCQRCFYCNIRTYACGFADCVGAFGIVCHYLYRACIGGIFLACDRTICVFPNGFALDIFPLDILAMRACGAGMLAFRQVLYRAFLCDSLRGVCALRCDDAYDFYQQKMV